MKIQFVLSQSNACLVIEKEKKKGPSQSYFLALHFGLYSLLFVCFNKHTRTRVQNFKLCCKFMFRQILSSNCLQNLRLLVEENGLKGLPMLATCYSVTLHAIKFQITNFYSRHLSSALYV